MDSRLDPIFKAQFRHAETLDTRQGIQRHEKDAPKKERGEKEDRRDDGNFGDDHTSVSVRALKTFLQQLLKEASPAEQNTEEAVGLSEEAKKKAEEPSKRTDPASQRAEKATQAYQRTYRAVHNEIEQPAPSALPDIDLNPDEIRTINALIIDLQLLLDNNVSELELTIGSSFLRSLVDAVTAVKSSLHI